MMPGPLLLQMQFDRLKRREVIAVLGGVAACPLAARAQQSEKLPIIGLLGANRSAERQRVAAFVQRVRELGWIEGRNVAIEYRWAEGRAERAAEIATEFVRLKVSVIVTWGTSPALASRLPCLSRRRYRKVQEKPSAGASSLS
jgi:putative tryptophan/tyrosine transport system substrate-binding protein